MHFSEIGEQLRAFRLQSGMRAEEIAARLGVSRAALYRYEKGEVIKLDTVMRLAELLKISPLSLLGIGVEYYNRPMGYFERLRQLEEGSDQITQVGRGTCYLISTPQFDELLAEVGDVWARSIGAGAAAARASVENLRGIFAARKRYFQQRRPTLINIYSIDAIEMVLRHGFCRGVDLPPALRERARQVAVGEVEHLVQLLDEDPFGVQLGLLEETPVCGRFHLLRGRDRAVLAMNPFNADGPPDGQLGIAMITSADEALSSHQRVAENGWKVALKGHAAGDVLKSLIVASKRA